MQTTIETDTTPQLAPEVEAARAALANLQGAADDAEAEAQRWATTFEREPTPQAHTNAAVSKQKAVNARATAQAYERDVLQPLVQRQIAAERAEIARELDATERAALRRFEVASEHLESFVRELDGAIAEFGALHLPRHEAQRAGVPRGRLSLADTVARMNERLAEFRGSSVEMHLKHAAITYEPHSANDAPITVTIHRPAKAVPGPIR